MSTINSESSQDFRIRPVSDADFPEVARLYKACFPESFLVRTGTSMLRRYIRWLSSRERNRPCTLVAEDSGGLVGYLSAGCYTENVQVSFMKEHRFRLAFAILLRPRVAFHPDFMLKIRRAWIGLRRYGADASEPRPEEASAAIASRWSPFRFHILSVAVLPRGRRRGIGSALLSKGEIEARSRDCTFMDAMVKASNDKSLGLFTRFGFEAVDPDLNSVQVKYEIG